MVFQSGAFRRSLIDCKAPNSDFIAYPISINMKAIGTVLYHFNKKETSRIKLSKIK